MERKRRRRWGGGRRSKGSRKKRRRRRRLGEEEKEEEEGGEEEEEGGKRERRGTEVELHSQEGVPVPQAGVEHVKVGPPHLLQVVLQHHLHTTEEEHLYISMLQGGSGTDTIHYTQQPDIPRHSSRRLKLTATTPACASSTLKALRAREEVREASGNSREHTSPS
ncbi:hypothetical protein CRUP_012025 [Coryphaenoides rupestris]|nr:hypothetical protein CRUP_012025 [Coryphaenoides rupestris]